jgi:hypothetical protein
VDDDATFRRLARLVLAAQAWWSSPRRTRSPKPARRPFGASPTAHWWTSSCLTATVSRLPAELTSLPWRPRVVVTSVLAANGSAAQAQRSGAQAFVPKADLARAPLARWLGAA